MANLPSNRKWLKAASTGLVLCCLLGAGGSVFAGPGREDPTETSNRAAEEADKIAARAQRDEVRYQEDRAKIESRAAEDPQRAAEDLAKLEADRQEDLQKAAEEAQEEAAKAAEDAADDAADWAEDAEENGGMTGSSEGMRDVAASENPDKDSRGYPVRRGEIVALDLSAAGLSRVQAKGFRLIAREDMVTLGGSVTRLAVPAGMEPEAAIDKLAKDEPDATFDYTHYYASQVVTAGAARTNGRAPITRRMGKFSVGMIDTGVSSHPALAGQQVVSRDFSNGRTTIPTGHGTAVASILVSDGAKTIHVANIFRGGESAQFTSADSIASALEWLVASRVPVINMSLSGPRNAILDRLIQRVSSKGTVIVAAAGNGGPAAPPAYPAALPSVIAVTAVDANLRVYRYANQGPYVDVAARGVNEPGAKASGGMALFTGTSFATPHVAAWLANCMISAPAGVCTKRLVASAKDLGQPGFDPVYGHGLVR
jgi:subtilisin family serine protease